MFPMGTASLTLSRGAFPEGTVGLSFQSNTVVDSRSAMQKENK